MTTWIYWLFDQ